MGFLRIQFRDRNRMGSLIVCLILSFVALVHGKSVLINEIVEGKLALNNVRAAEVGKTIMDFGRGFMNPVSFEGAVAIGLDSFNRTGDCSMDFGDNSIKYSYSIGQAIHAVYFRRLNSPYGEGSGYYRAFNNRITYEYTVNYARRCQVNVDNLHIQISNVELCVTSTCLNSNSDAGFANLVSEQLNPGLNKFLAANTQKIEDSLNKVYCRTNARFDSDDQIGKGLYVLSDTLFN